MATPAPKVFREDARIEWDAPAQDVHNHIRGMSPIPGAFTYHKGLLLKALRSTLAEGGGRPGEVLRSDAALTVACGSGAVEIVEAQLEGRRCMLADELLRGYSVLRGDLLNKYSE